MTQRFVHGPGAESDPSTDSYSLLIVDDDELILSLLHDLLTYEERYRMTIAADPRAAIDVLRREPFDLIITDYRMPAMTGLDLIREARRLYPDVIGILVTGLAWPDVADEAGKAGAYDLIPKPLNMAEVRVTVRNACERIRLIRDNRRCQRELERMMCVAARDDQSIVPSEAIMEMGLFPPSPSPAVTRMRKGEQMPDQLEKLGRLYQTGLLTKEEFDLSKKKLIGRI